MARQTALAYIRVSVVGDRQARGRFESPDLQRNAIDQWCHAHGITITDEIRDLNRSGGTLTRPGLNKALEAIKAGHADGVVVARLDRASRRTLHGLGLIEEFAELGGWIAAADGSIDTTTRMGRMATTMNLAMAESELERYKEQAEIIHARAILEKGRHMGPAPYGYTRDPDGRLIPEPSQARIVRQVFERRADGEGWAAVCRELETVRRSDDRVLSALQLSRMVKRRVYLGEASHGTHVKQNAHPAILDEALWRAANRQTPVTRAASSTPRKTPESLLRGVLRCSGCRFVLKRQPQPSGKVRWLCRTLASDRTASHVCTRPVVIRQADSKAIEERVVAAFMDLATEAVVHPVEAAEHTDLERGLTDAEALLDELSSLDLRRQLGAERWQQMVAQAREGVERAHRELSKSRVGQGTGSREELERLWPLMTLAQKQQSLRSIIQAVMIDADGGLHVIPVWDHIDLPSAGQTFAPRPWPS